mmetsp:Transcript_9006/g.23597  ORF Transcript_9006/g.23597 Transcript_9006/m.23597 type:complete len:507 (+) Transcript_9006:353-1873(+)
MDNMTSGGNINIGGVEDEHYRYKMPSLIPKVEGRGNGIKTRIVNCAEIAKALKRPPGYVCKFFGCELGALTQIDDKTGVYIVNGAFDQRSLAELLEKFIKMYVLCEECKLPETTLKVSKSNIIKQSCLACGHSFQVDMMHKLTNYIINNPPSSDGNTMGAKKKSAGMDKKERRKKKAERAEDDANGVDDTEDKKEKKSKKKKESSKEAGEDGEKSKKKASKKKKKTGSGGDDEDDDGGEDSDNIVWATDTSKEAMAARLAEAEVAAKILGGDGGGGGSKVSLNSAENAGADDEGASKEGSSDHSGDNDTVENDDNDDDDDIEIDKLKELISDGMKGEALAEAAEEAAARSLGDDASSEAVRVCAAGYVVDAFVNASAVAQPVKLVKALVPVLKALGVGCSFDAQLQVCNRMDRLCEELETAEEEAGGSIGNEGSSTERTIVTQLLKVFIDNEVLEEKALVQWYDRAVYSDAMIAARKAAEPIVTWVQGMNDDDDDDDEEGNHKSDD